MTLRSLVSCDSNPAPYAGGQDWPCRAWRTSDGDSSLRANHEAIREGWTVELVSLPDGSHTYRHTCPACVRAAAALGQTRVTGFEAQYRGRCSGCDCPIEPGERVRYVDDDLLHEACADDAEQRAVRAERSEPSVCPACWTVHAGECL